MQGNGVQVGFQWSNPNAPWLGVSLAIPATTFVSTVDGEPRPGIVMQAALARELAFSLLLAAEQLTNRSCPLPPCPLPDEGLC